MNIREWAENSGESKSKVDFTVDSILKSYLTIINMFAEKEYSYSSSELEEFLVENMKHHHITKWYVKEGKEFLQKLAAMYSEENEVLYEELDYCLFILKSEENNLLDWPEDVLGTIVNISDQVIDLMSRESSII